MTTITPRQIISLVLRASLITVSSRGQETRDLLFARLFGLTSVVQSGLLYRPTATIDDFKTVVHELINVGKAKAWLRESCWWAVIKAIEGLEAGQVEWRQQAGEWTAELVFADQEGKMDWTPEKVALGLKMQEIYTVSGIDLALRMPLADLTSLALAVPDPALEDAPPPSVQARLAPPPFQPSHHLANPQGGLLGRRGRG